MLHEKSGFNKRRDVVIYAGVIYAKRQRKWAFRFAALLTWLACLLVMSVPTALAQLPTAAVSGYVRDSSGAVIPQATVTASNRETGQTRTAPVSADGHYKIGALPVGAYDIKAEAVSFQQEVKTDLVLTVGQEAVLNFSLTVGTLT